MVIISAMHLEVTKEIQGEVLPQEDVVDPLLFYIYKLICHQSQNVIWGFGYLTFTFFLFNGPVFETDNIEDNVRYLVYLISSISFLRRFCIL